VLSIFQEENGRSYYDAAIERGVEGVIAKRKHSSYQPGVRSSDWLKIKSLSSCDCVMFGYTTGEGRRKSTFGALILGLYEAGTPVYVGKVGTGFSSSTIEVLKHSFRDLEVTKASLDNVDVSQQVTWIKPVFVCEVEYQSPKTRSFACQGSSDCDPTKLRLSAP
jgi:bifunctional non-homologous end joining protein LigD